METAPGYCAGCARVCEAAVEETVPISDIMRCLMYSSCYRDHEKAVRLFNTIPGATRERLADVDYSRAERLCPQNIPISKIVKKTVEKMTIATG